MNVDAAAARVRCRPIGDDDVAGVVEVLHRGFPGRSQAYWRAGLDRQRARALPAGVPRYGFMLESEGKPVGVILLLYAAMDGGLRANLSSWYVEPPFRAHASTLIFMATRRKDVTYTNISPARHTWPTIEAQGFRRITSGQFLGVPWLSRGSAEVRAVLADRDGREARLDAVPEAGVLRDHAAMGWLSLVVEAEGEAHPFVFMPFRVRSGRVRLPIRQLVFCRSIADYVRFAGPIGRFLLRRGTPFVVHDADGPEPGLVGRYRHDTGPKYALGPHAPRRGDLAYTERVIFGP